MAGDYPPNPAHELLAEGADLPELTAAADSGRSCDLYRRDTQAVLGEGPVSATFLLVGEQPGDREDEQGVPFVGPAGRVLDDALAQAGIDRAEAYVTKVVRHFKWKAGTGSKPRLHAKPNRTEIEACRPWLDAEMVIAVATIHPSAVLRAGEDRQGLLRSARSGPGVGGRRRPLTEKLRDGVHHLVRCDLAEAGMRL